jgi:hypothetical protein
MPTLPTSSRRSRSREIPARRHASQEAQRKTASGKGRNAVLSETPPEDQVRCGRGMRPATPRFGRGGGATPLAARRSRTPALPASWSWGPGVDRAVTSSLPREVNERRCKSSGSGGRPDAYLFTSQNAREIARVGGAWSALRSAFRSRPRAEHNCEPRGGCQTESARVREGSAVQPEQNASGCARGARMRSRKSERGPIGTVAGSRVEAGISDAIGRWASRGAFCQPKRRLVSEAAWRTSGSLPCWVESFEAYRRSVAPIVAQRIKLERPDTCFPITQVPRDQTLQAVPATLVL